MIGLNDAGSMLKVSLPQSVLLPTDFVLLGYCKRGEKCWFLHVDSDTPATASGSSQDGDEEQDFCSICFEKPSIYGLLGVFSCHGNRTSLIVLRTRRLQPYILYKSGPPGLSTSIWNSNR